MRRGKYYAHSAVAAIPAVVAAVVVLVVLTRYLLPVINKIERD